MWPDILSQGRGGAVGVFRKTSQEETFSQVLKKWMLVRLMGLVGEAFGVEGQQEPLEKGAWHTVGCLQ